MAKNVEFNATCIATYRGTLTLPESVDANNMDEVLTYIRDNLNVVPCENLEYIGDTDEPVTVEDIINVWEDTGEI